ncbi:tetratricopeptide repeat protein [Phyllobacterium sp. 0TCS1.6C]|uniref:alginate O-acetyltransferase AlgX-related protein n=1 Tax=unclassified Phyllobacterium TaxID=2638441 RepID=UPI0022653C87|nr:MULTISPECIES: tetratricopeptide repeat protein [unclassified Phyllobacterium]MCX8282172.1 tetratricopeptide repeat protein [Phyllobacterium sp. 0TCS1.6C]MCX8296380.1 tetratricopeptide repeat protein [Phyllobacterium sp. 0TCS1.6A]
MTDDFTSTSRADKSKKYLLGKDGWIFLDHDSNRVIDQITGRHSLDAQGVEAWRNLIAERDAYVEALGAQHLVFVAPNKELVYDEQLPDWVELSEKRPINQILRALTPQRASRIIYPLEALKAAKAGGLTYPKTDTHWSGYGAYVGYQAICEGLSRAGIEPLRLENSRVSFEEVPYVGDLGVKFEPPVSAPTLSARIANPAGKMEFDNRIPNRGRIRVFVNKDSTLPRCVMFGDSFGGNLLPYLKESFSTLVYIYGKSFDRELIEAYRPDVVLSEFVERFLIEPPVDTPYFTYASVVRGKLRLLSKDDLAAASQQTVAAEKRILPVRPIYEALLSAHMGKSVSAELLAELKRVHPANPEAQHLISVELSRLGENLDEAKVFAEKAVAAQPWNARARHQLALTFMRLEQPEKAEAQLRKAIELDSVDWWSYQLAQVLFRQQNYGPCVDILREYIARRPDSADAWQLLGRCHEALDATEDAAEAFARASDAKPEWTWPLLKLANLRVRTKTRPEQGILATDRLLESLFQARQRAEIYLLRSQLYEIGGDRDKAAEAALRGTELAPDWDWANSTLQRLQVARTG